MLQTQLAAAATVQSVLAGQNLTVALDTNLRKARLTEQQRAAVQALSYGTLRHLGFVRFVLDQLVARQPENGQLVALLLVALYQLEYSKAPQYAVVDHAVKSAATFAGRPLKSFVNAVLRQFLRRRDSLREAARDDDVARLSYPRWWIDKLRQQLGAQAEPVMQIGNQHPPMTLRVNRRRTTVEQYLALLERERIAAKVIGVAAVRLDEPLPVQRLPGFAEGLVSVQDAGAQHAAQLLDVKPGQTVLDACAAPGGKTGHILELADVHLTALDQDPGRLERVRDNLARLGLMARVQCADAAEVNEWWDGIGFDRVLLDAPCSASGVVRRHPDIKWLRRQEDIAAFAQQQRRLLEALWRVVATGGTLLYVTCSIFREENQAQIDWFSSRHSDARLSPRCPGDRGDLLLPSQDHDGFFHALFEKA